MILLLRFYPATARDSGSYGSRLLPGATKTKEEKKENKKRKKTKTQEKENNKTSQITKQKTRYSCNLESFYTNTEIRNC